MVTEETANLSDKSDTKIASVLISCSKMALCLSSFVMLCENNLFFVLYKNNEFLNGIVSKRKD